MTTPSQKEKAQTLLSLHQNNQLLILPNIWDPLGARILEAKGYSAIATASAAISAAMGYQDHENIKRSTLIDILTRIAKSVDLPVTADFEAGYGESLTDLKESIRQVIDSGVVGINIEDGLGQSLRSVKEECERIALVREIANQQDLHLVINARIDTFILKMFETNEERIEDAIVRAKAYTEAGADCIYPIGVVDEPTLKTLRANISTPLNVIVTGHTLSLSELQRLGINRASFGPFVHRACMGKFVEIVDEMQGSANYDCVTKGAITGPEMEKFLISGKE